MNPVFSVSDAVAFINQTLDYAYPTITVVGEISAYRVSKGKWLYFDVKDDESKLKCFSSIYQMKMPLEDGMQVEVTARPRLHNLYGFSLNVESVKPVGEGSIKKAASILQAKLEKEGLFDEHRKRSIPRFLNRIALITSDESAAYADFTKILNQRWQGVEVVVFNTQVQGESAVEMIVDATARANQYPESIDAIVLIRGGGSADDLSAFSSEQVTRAVASSRIPVCVAIGHESDTSLAELAADLRASTPSNAAELLFPDRHEAKEQLNYQRKALMEYVKTYADTKYAELSQMSLRLEQASLQFIDSQQNYLTHIGSLLESIHPKNTLKRGYALVESEGKLVSTIAQLQVGTELKVTLKDGNVLSKVNAIKKGQHE